MLTSFRRLSRRFGIGLLGVMSITSQIFMVPTTIPVFAAEPVVVINELMWMGSSASSADEWIELRNMTNQSVDVSGWSLTKKSSGAESAMVTLPSGQIIPPQGYFLISNYAETNVNSVLLSTPDVISTDIALSNTALQIKLYDAAHILVDTADDGAGNPLAGELSSANQVFFSMERNVVPGDGILAQSWHTASQTNGFKENKIERGSSRLINTNAVPVSVAGPDQSGHVGQEINFDGSDSTDADNQALEFTWNFGDNHTANGPTPTHIFSVAGEYVITMRVFDGIAEAVDSVKVVVQEAPPPVTPTPGGESGTKLSSETAKGNATRNSAAEKTETSVVTSCAGARISEVFPNPAGKDDNEFLELENVTNQEVVLSGCKIWINATRVYIIPEKIVIPAAAFYQIPKSLSHVSLNNMGATIRLVNTDGAELSRVEYTAVVENHSWARIGGSWQWTDRVTPGEKNVEPSEEAQIVQAAKAAKKIATKTKNAPKKTSKYSSTKVVKPIIDARIDEIFTLDVGDRVRFQAVVTVNKNVLGADMAYVQDSTGAIAVKAKKDGPDILLGQEVQIVGAVGSYQGQPRVTIETLTRVNTEEVHVLPAEVAMDAVTVDISGRLVHVRGLVSTSSGSKFDVDDGTGSQAVFLKSTSGIIKPKMKTGDHVEVIGIVNVTTSGIRILPRRQDDITVKPVIAHVSPKTSNPPQVLPTSSPHQQIWYWVLVGLSALAAVARPAWQAWKNRQSDSVTLKASRKERSAKV